MIAPVDGDAELVAALRAGDERAFMTLVERYHAQMTRIALMYVKSRAVADDVVSEAWLALLNGLDRFEGRSSLRTWLFRIVSNIAKTRAVREARSVPFSSVFEPDDDEPVVDPSRFAGGGAWATPPASWDATPEEIAVNAEAMAMIAAAIQQLPPTQRVVVQMRDVDGFDADEVCEALDITPVNQRVLLHRGRARVREALERYFAEERT
jgi:RNA polymerase sigma-70 factor, ECF subfamily